MLFSRRGVTIVELVVVVLILGMLLALLLPATECAREAARRANCLNNLKQIGLGFQNMDSARRRFPPAIDVAKDEAGNVTAMGGAPGLGWSWAVHILPFMENRPLYDTLDITGGYPLDGTKSSNISLRSPVKEYMCPSFSGEMYVNPSTQTEFITNYKVLGATHAASLAQATAIDPKPEPAYVSDYHPDGACFPGSTHGTDGFSRDGTAHTAVVVETTEPYFARWMVGAETVVVGLPDEVAFREPEETGLEYVCPAGYELAPKMFWEKTTVINNETYLLWDYDEHPYDENAVLSARGGLVASSPPGLPKSLRKRPSSAQIGPSSHHTGVVNHMLADGSIQGISEDIDAAAYMFLITRIGGEPNAPLD